MTAQDPAIHGNSAPRPDDDHFSRQNGLCVHFDDLAVSEHARGLGKKVQHVLNGAAPAADGEPFENLRCEDKRGDDQRGEELADRQRGNEGDGHGELHRHAALKNVLERLFEDGVAADQRGHQADDAYPVERLPEMKPNRRRGKRDKDDAKYLDQFKAMFMFVVLFRRDVGDGVVGSGR